MYLDHFISIMIKSEKSWKKMTDHLMCIHGWMEMASFLEGLNNDKAEEYC